jgi:hypothetical protein
VDIGNTIIQTSPTGGDIDTSNSTNISHGYNLCSGSGGGVLTQTTDQKNIDPMLGPLKDNDGPTLTHAPLINSPAIDLGKRDAVPALNTNLDQRGLGRPVDDPGVANLIGDTSDIGAVEIQQFVHPFEAASWKTHGPAGPFPLALSFSGTPQIECRSGGASGNHQIVVIFNSPVAVADADVTTGTGSVSGFSVTSANRAARAKGRSAMTPNSVTGNSVTINLTGVTDGQTIVVALFGVSDGSNTADIGIPMSVSLGDVTQNGMINSSDISQVKAASGQQVTDDNFKEDVTVNGAINSSDIALTKSQSGG